MDWIGLVLLRKSNPQAYNKTPNTILHHPWLPLLDARLAVAPWIVGPAWKRCSARTSPSLCQLNKLECPFYNCNLAPSTHFGIVLLLDNF